MKMSEDVARALGAGGEGLSFNGKKAQIKPVGIKYLTEVQRECLRQFKRSYLETYKDNLDLLDMSIDDLKSKADEVGRWALEDLPRKDSHDPKHLILTQQLKDWVNENVLEEPLDDDRKYKQVIASALDNGMLSDDLYFKATNEQPKKTQINYVSWWITATIEGMVEMAYASFRDQGITKEDIYIELGNNFARLAEISRDIEQITSPQIDGENDKEENGQSPEK